VNPEKCDDCGLCVENCHSAAIAKVGEVKTIVPHEPYEVEADVVVLGGGISGLISAIRCAQLSGKKVVVLEKTAHVGGNAWFGHGPIPVGTRWDIEAGGVDIREDYIKWVKTAFKGKFRDGLIHNAVYACGEFFDWLVSLDEKEARECFKVEPNVKIWFQDIPPRWSVGFPVRKYFHLNCKDAAMGPGFAGSYTIRKMMQKAPEYGVEVLYNRRAVELRLDKDGKFCGVIAEDEGGRTFVKAKACVVATGNCMYHDELIKQQWPLFFGKEGDEPVHKYGIAGNTGDVMLLAKSIGVTVDPANLRVNMFGPVHHPFNYVFFAYGLQPDIIYVNMNGDRFYNESRFANGSTVMHLQPKRKAYAIIDDDTFEAIGKRMSPDEAEDSTGMSTFSEPTTKDLMKHYREEMESEVAYDFPMFRADTLEELAEKCGIDPGKFVATIEKYNGYCDAGFDPDFGKDPATLKPIRKAPFYAILGKMATDQISIGTHISDNCEMVDNDGKVIPGIFVTGDNAADWQYGMEDGPGEHRGHIISDMTWATASGYLAGKNVADYLASC
jgi:fumarate reductase flavoprotein subunit